MTASYRTKTLLTPASGVNWSDPPAPGVIGRPTPRVYTSAVDCRVTLAASEDTVKDVSPMFAWAVSVALAPLLNTMTDPFGRAAARRWTAMLVADEFAWVTT